MLAFSWPHENQRNPALPGRVGDTLGAPGEAFHAATMDPRFANVEMQDLFAGGAGHEEL